MPEVETYSGETLTIRTCGPIAGLSPQRRSGMAGVIHDTRVDIKNLSGWTQGTYESALTGGHCILGAIEKVRDRHDDEDVALATAYLQEHLPGRDGIVSFNDAFFRMKGRVVAELGRCEVELAPQEHARCGALAEREGEAASLGELDELPAGARLGPEKDVPEPRWRWARPCVVTTSPAGEPVAVDDVWEPVELEPTTSDRVAEVVSDLGGARRVVPVGVGVLTVSWLVAPVALLVVAGLAVVAGVGAVVWRARSEGWGARDVAWGDLGHGGQDAPCEPERVEAVSSSRADREVVVSSAERGGPGTVDAGAPSATEQAEVGGSWWERQTRDRIASTGDRVVVVTSAHDDGPRWETSPREWLEEAAPAESEPWVRPEDVRRPGSPSWRQLYEGNWTPTGERLPEDVEEAPRANRPDVLPGDVEYQPPTTLEQWAAERGPVRVEAQRQAPAPVEVREAVEVPEVLTEGLARRHDGRLALALPAPATWRQRDLRAAWMPGVERDQWREVVDPDGTHRMVRA